MSDVVLKAENLSKGFTDADKEILAVSDVNLEILRGDDSAIVGASGSGKTTLLHLLGGLDSPSAGSVSILGQSYNGLNEAEKGWLRNKHVGFIYQFHHLLPEFSAIENVCMPLQIRGVSKREAMVEALELLEKVNLSDRKNHKPAELSGGERQRVAIARALVTKPSIVLADEPTGNLDSQTAQAVEELMLGLNEDLGIAFLTVTHDTGLASRRKKVFRMVDGKLEQEK